MNQKHIQYASALVILAALLFSCDKPSATEEATQTQQNNQQTNPTQNNTNPPAGNCTRFAEAAVVKVSGPAIAHVNTEVTLNVDYGVIDGCGGFGRYEISETDFNYNITLIAKYEGCLCTANAPTLKTTYSFTPTKAGICYLKFKKGIQQAVVHQITINKLN